MRQFEYNFEGDEYSNHDEEMHQQFEEDDDDTIYGDDTYSDMDYEMIDSLINYEKEQDDLNKELLNAAVRICEKGIFWRFRTLKKKMEMITEAYIVLTQLMEIDLGE